MAFSTSHDVLQEVVGAVTVTPAGCKRPDLRQIHEALKDRLDQPKWPTILVYMDNVPKTHNKLRRIQLSRRLGLETLTDDTLPSDCHYEAICPQPETPLDILIDQRRCAVQPEAVLFSDIPSQLLPHEIFRRLRILVDGYLVPSSIRIVDGPAPVNSGDTIDEAAVDAIIRSQALSSISPTEQRVCGLFADALRLTLGDVTPTTDFFLAGGDSLTAGRLVSRIRQEFSVRLASDVLFRHSTVSEVSIVVEEAMARPKAEEKKSEDLPGCLETYSSTNPAILLLNLIPLGVFSPTLQTLRWSMFVYILIQTFRWRIRDSVIGRLFLILLSGVVDTGLVYPMWGPYHSRWWLTQKVLQVCGKGIFGHFGFTRVLYYRALGARIGRNVRIHPQASLGEYDLIEIGDNVVLDDCSCRPFSAERNTSMLLQPIRIGADCTVGLKAVIASDTDLPQGTCLGPNTSSWEMEDAQESNRELASAQIPQPHWIWYVLVVGLLSLLVSFVSRLPAIVAFFPVVMKYRQVENDMLRQQVLWFVSPSRIGYYALVILTGAVVGTHYELVSIAVRMLGGRVGKRVYWPGTGIAMVQDYDLLEIGNDVVFGSRSTFVTSDGVGRDRIVIGDGAFVGDHVVALPGVMVGKRTTIGSGALLRRNGSYPDNTTWTGSNQENLDKLDLKNEDSDTISPFGRAFYNRQASYYVLRIGPIVAYSTLAAAIGAVYSASSILTGLLVVSRPFIFYAAFTVVVGVVTLMQAAIAMEIKIAAKWMILGRRQEGFYPWDRSSYCQRWQILLTIERIFTGYSGRMNAMVLLTGTAYMVHYYRALGDKIGADFALAASGEADLLMTEPDLVTLGNRVTIDHASLVGHLNTRGDFELHPLQVGSRSVLKTKSRLLSGASVGVDACLLEHTLVLSGDHIDDGCTVQGWPAEPFMESRAGHSFHLP
ncbi:Bacterial transferase hexapeptide repeat [Trichophyton rubrum]|nr:Bacterial transferase hexapeptide repeat [Trichophyton rubrum]